MTHETLRCADASESRSESLYGTASHVLRWLLLEQPGSWGPDALRESALPERVATELSKRARAAGVRIVLIRRGVRFASERRNCYFIRTTGDRDLYLAHLALGDVDEILDVDLEPLRDGGEVPGTTLQREPVFLVCTHGRHDACCSIRGNKVSRIACAMPDTDAWESSHIGGDRFAANLVSFPHGIYQGRIAPDDVAGLIEGYKDGVLSLDHYRGRCCYPFHVQAAEYFVRKETSSFGIDDLFLVKVWDTGSGGFATRFNLGGTRSCDVEVRVGRSEGSFRLTCGSRQASPIPVYELVSCEVRDL